MTSRRSQPTDKLLWFQPPDPTLPDLEVLARVRRPAATLPMDEHRHAPDRLEIVYMISGRRLYFVNGQPHMIVGNDVLIVPPNATHSSGGICQGKSAHYIVVVRLNREPGSFLDLQGKPAGQLREALRRLPGGRCVGRMSMRALLEAALDARANTAFDSDPLGTARLQIPLAAFLLEVVACATTSQPRAPSSWLQRMLAYLNTHLDTPTRIREIAAHMGTSESQIKHRFKAETGLSPADYQLRRRIDRAMSCLTENDMTITRLALDLGFSTSQHFASVFRRYVGVSPAAFRRAQRAAPVAATRKGTA
jgi:AraC-like DNA-binding protein